MRQPRWKPGTNFAIQVGAGGVAYGLALRAPYMAFYLSERGTPFAPGDLLRLEPEFVTAVARSVVGDARWISGGIGEVPEQLSDAFVFGHQDALSGGYVRRVSSPDAPWQEYPASYEDVRDLEPSAVWDAVHLVERLAAAMEGRPSEFLESIRVRPPRYVP